MKNILVVLIISAGITFAQKCYVESVTGTAKAQIGSSEKWMEVGEGAELPPYSTISTSKNSSVVLVKGNTKFTLKESAAVTVNHIKKMSTDDLLLALAMEDMMNAPRKKDKNKSKSTQVYGDQNKNDKTPGVSNDEFGLMRLNGAKQLGDNGFEESAIVAAKETYRKYPETKKIISQRIYFANLLYEKGLFEEAYAEFNSFKDYGMSEKNKAEVDSKIELLSKKLINK
ncbi:MAG: hypothetical protein A2315_09425 [Ignavibacteria bacterium RIFOXYB2_FULL_35_12]|nr:MAG: hypothetical protein A2058_10800 [Ignavibacteria bacterium GWA2_36_19]OGU62507.1 MAG: hypothetical protein A2X60_17950 [Ignavibacteria bacterium GWF2_35_20]OGU87996.1 MAG: hypothetical protein A2492_13505 [Ignavibacteria bacterium RIFOXYC12_FULL_35_11]OGU96136.1 MAG: hypothetical protein A2347_03940 [Ignavibacteria bacterium RIFOXYB12_FULL_35_14]OGU99858.1 MAG: hypothetical protein A2455_11080 [Ignavibacteria bacterium RIFOXYC2_FULL_35_16]OGV01986.1 MAG: hypothetical protein A2315_0942